MSKRFSVHFNKSCKDFGALQIICNCTSRFCYGGFENFKKKASLVCFHWILHLSISFLFVELTYAALRVLLFAFYFSIAFFVFSLQSQNAEQELQQAKTLMEDQARTNNEHKRRINKVFEKAEPLKVRIKAKWLMHQAWDSGRKWGVRGPCLPYCCTFARHVMFMVLPSWVWFPYLQNTVVNSVQNPQILSLWILAIAFVLY